MNFNKIKEILDILSRVGVEEVAIESAETEHGTINTTVRGASADRQIVVHHTFEEDLIDGVTIGIAALKPFLSRLNLFDMDKIKVSFDGTQEDGSVEQLTIKEGKRKITYRCYDIDYLGVPSQIPNNLATDDKFDFDNERVLYWIKVGNSLLQTARDKEETKVSFSYDDSTIKISIVDGEDKYEEEIEMNDIDLPSVDFTRWSLVPFSKLMKEALAHGDRVKFGVTENGVAVVRMSDIDIALSPL